MPVKVNTNKGGEYEVEGASGCFGCVFWLAAFIIFCILAVSAVSWVWDWALG